jgi:oligopeptide transport system permease protein
MSEAAQTEINAIDLNKGVEALSPWQESWLRLKKNRVAVFALWTFGFIVVLSLLAPVIAPYDPNEQDILKGPVAPSFEHWFGTDTLGRDLLSRTLYGGRISILVGITATLVAMGIGVTWGSIAGFFGGWIDNFMMRIVDILYSLPFMIFVILLMTIFERSLFLLFVAIGFVEWLTLSRIVRGQMVNLKTMPYVEAARCLGVSRPSLIIKHLVPNLIGPVIIYATLTIPAVMLLESALSFLGLGVQPPDSSWGSLINDGAEKMISYPWLLIFPSLFFSLTLFCLNFIGDGLRDAFDPKSKT